MRDEMRIGMGKWRQMVGSITHFTNIGTTNHLTVNRWDTLNILEALPRR